MRRHDKCICSISKKPIGQYNDVGLQAKGITSEDIAVQIGAKQESKLSNSSGDGKPVGSKRTKEQQQKQIGSSKKPKLGAESVAAQIEQNMVLKLHYEQSMEL